MNLIPSEEIEATKLRLVENSEPEPYSGCWIWSAGYFGHKFPEHRRPAIYVGKKQHFAYRISFEAFKGEIPDGLLVCHSCDTAACINPRHLFAGTHSQNLSDAWNKNRRSYNPKSVRKSP